MVLILDSKIGAHVRINIFHLICVRHLIRSRAVTNQIYFSEKTYFPSRVRMAVCNELPANISTTGLPDKANSS